MKNAPEGRKRLAYVPLALLLLLLFPNWLFGRPRTLDVKDFSTLDGFRKEF